ncbi:ABC transporter permease subunit [Oleiagrimonas sp. C23AA]|uniref:ABC transporter permease subunit n=1 Tax=Oleiagrimonas sp. C23AA TaxID=2719047 RepID=UPI00142170C5|nr:ABC transporter permease subunit [Oleiagrimonas sp. C23AA]NII10780.1 ABC transporter permease subunit [Oleiagrimonas sp. C23AA]
MNTCTPATRVYRPGTERALGLLGGGLPLLALALFFVYPLLSIGWRSFTVDGAGGPTLANYLRLWSEPGIARAAWHSLTMSGTVTVLALAAGLLLAMLFKRSRVRGRRLMFAVLMLPMLAPSLMQGLGLLFLLGRNGLVHRWTGLDTDIYGFWGLVAANAIYALPQATLIIAAALERTDHRHYDAALTMGASPWRQFLDITLAQSRYGLLAAVFVVFSVTITDFGNAIVLGGPYRVLANEVYDQVAGQMDINMGAAVGMLLLLPALASLLVERSALRRAGTGSEHARPADVRPGRGRDLGLGLGSVVVLAPVLAVFATVVYASLVKLWPYRLELTLAHYHTDLPDGYTPIFTSLKLALLTALAGTVLVFALTLLVRRARPSLARGLHVMATLPAAVPGLVIGIAYLMSFNTGPLADMLYGSLFLMAACNLYHYHAQSYLMLATGMRAVPGALEDAVTCLGGGLLRRLRDVVLPFTAPTVASVFFFLFMQSMVTLSAVVFLVTPELNLASVAVMQLDANGFVSQAAAYATCIVASVAAAALAMRVCATLLARHFQRRTPDVA